MNYSRIPVVLLALALLAPAHAEQMFVIDKVVLNVYPEPNTAGRKVAALETGDTVEVIDELEPYSQVRLSDGRVGWVRSNFLSKQVPAILRLKELQSAQSTTQENPSPQQLQELVELKQRNAALQGEVTQLRQEAAAKPASVPAPLPAKPVVSTPAPQVAPAAPPPVDQPAAVKLWAWVAAVLAGGALGFLLGYQTLATHIKRKYGNIKIY